ncbi:hypothetical protein EBZ80_27320 [bacterium]|nr:hypothetical protein [bacterium]
MKPGDLVRFKEGTPIFKRQGETLALITKVVKVEVDDPKIIFLYLLMPAGEVEVRRSEDVEIIDETR